MPDFFMEGDDNAHSPIWMRDYSDPPDDVPFNRNAKDMLGTLKSHNLNDRLDCMILFCQFSTNRECLVHLFYRDVDEVLRRVKASRIVMGHTPQSQINAALNGKAWRIDVGMSRGMNGTYPEVLEVVKNNNGEEIVWVLTSEGRIPAEERHVLDDDQADDTVST